MSDNATAEVLNDRYFRRLLPQDRSVPSVDDDARTGLLSTPRWMPPKYFYDARGSRLFEQICDTEEYYPTRLESALLRDHSKAIVAQAAATTLVEFGSGNSLKTRHLLNALTDRSGDYHAIDVCGPILDATANDLLAEYPGLRVTTHVGDYHGGFSQLDVDRSEPVLAVFLGGTIGNFSDDEARAFLREISDWLGPDQHFLMGFDRVKSPARLVAAYDDAEGITAEFNLNVLNVLNRELNADFDARKFQHKAVYAEESDQIEMYVVSNCRQTVTIGALGATLDLDAGERILTEISRKFTHDSIDALLSSTGFEGLRYYDAPRQDYSLVSAKTRA